ncbi:Imm49 family immunity protein [Nocardia sp. NPDC059180]|uniref:Imm49 family immunity protein n=1 Tax=Nocardia sp. NPDC059180 TaxID=3346761 RepID=UPI0036C0B74F
MRIERRRIDDAVLAAARDGFTERIQGECHSMTKSTPMGSGEWWRISGIFLDYLGALSVVVPDLDAPEVKAVIDNAAEAAAGGVQCAAYFGNTSFNVSLDYADFWIGYPVEDPRDPDPVGANQWLDAFCLAILSEKAEWHGEAFHFTRRALDGGMAGQPNVELVNGLVAYTLGYTEDDDDYPPSGELVLATIDAALSRVRVGESFLDLPHRTALRALRALAVGDQDAFGTELTESLLQYHSMPDLFGEPRVLLPLVPLALTALAYRREGWQPPVDTDYLPRTLITG